MDMNSSTIGRDCTNADSGNSSSAVDTCAALAFSSSALRSFSCTAAGMESKPLIDSTLLGSTAPPDPAPSTPDLNVFLYAPFGWYMTPMSVMDPPLSLSFILATRWSVMPKNLRRSASEAEINMPSYSSICSSVPSATFNCGAMRAISLVKLTKPVKSSSTKRTSSPKARAPSAMANAVHVAA